MAQAIPLQAMGTRPTTIPKEIKLAAGSEDSAQNPAPPKSFLQRYVSAYGPYVRVLCKSPCVLLPPLLFSPSMMRCCSNSDTHIHIHIYTHIHTHTYTHTLSLSLYIYTLFTPHISPHSPTLSSGTLQWFSYYICFWEGRIPRTRRRTGKEKQHLQEPRKLTLLPLHLLRSSYNSKQQPSCIYSPSVCARSQKLEVILHIVERISLRELFGPCNLLYAHTIPIIASNYNSF